MTAEPLPPTSLIICSRNRPGLLVDVVESVLAGQELPTEIVVVDDSDTPNAGLESLDPGLTKACTLRYLWTHTSGLSRANNTAIAAARHDVLIFTQDDVLVAPNWFGALVRALLDAGDGTVVTGRVLPGEETVDDRSAFAPSTRSDTAPVVYAHRTQEDVLYVQNLALYRHTAAAVGPWDERLGPGTAFPSAEDNDFALRLIDAGYRIAYVPNAVVYHRPWRGGQDYVPLRWAYGLGRGAFYAKYLRLSDSYALRRLTWDVRVHLVAAALRFRRDRLTAQGDAALALGMVWGAARWLTSTARVR